jgi:beta-mannosidase
LDYFGRWKALHYAAKRFYAPLLLSVEDQGKVMGVHVTSDLVEPVDVLVRWRLETLDGALLDSGEHNLRAGALADTRVGVYDFSTLVSTENQRKVVFVAEMWRDGQLVSQNVTPFAVNKHLELSDPDLKLHTELDGQSLCITVSASSLARFVELSIDGMDAVFSDNYFDVTPDRSVTVTTPLPENWVESSTVQARSLYDSFA